jgi:hypothetical protein
MLKGLAIFALVLSVVQTPVPPTIQTSSKEVQRASSPSLAQPQNQPQSKSTGRDWADWVLWATQLSLAIAAIVGIRFAYRTVKSAEDSAKAARLNAQAIINAERAWLVVVVDCPSPNTFRFRATNVGKTPAKVIAIRGEVTTVRRPNKLSLPLTYGEYESLSSSPPCFLPPTASCTVFQCNIEELREKDFSVDEWLQHLRMGFRDMFFHGKVKYFDTLETDTPHETKWLYWVLPIQGALPIPDPDHPEYNSYT